MRRSGSCSGRGAGTTRPSTVEISTKNGPPAKANRREPRPQSLPPADFVVPDGRAIAEELRPGTPDRVYERVENCRLNPGLRGGEGAAAMDALLEIVRAREDGFAWAPDGGSPATRPAPSDLNAPYVVPIWVAAQIAERWNKFENKYTKTLDDSFDVKPSRGQSHFAEKRKLLLDQWSGFFQVSYLMRVYGLNQSKAINEVATKTGVDFRTLQRHMKQCRDILDITNAPPSHRMTTSDRDPLS